MQLFPSSSKTDHDNRGQNMTMPALTRLLPVPATAQWLSLGGIEQGALLRGIDRRGNLSERPLNVNSLSRVLRQVLLRSGVDSKGYSAHSLRRDFATWASRNQWRTKDLMAYVGWRDVQSAARYIEVDAPFDGWAR